MKKCVRDLESKIDFPRYGVSGVGGSSPTLTRLWDAAGLTAQVGTDGDNSAVRNDFDALRPFARRKCVGNWIVAGGRPAFNVQAYFGDPDYTEDGSKGDYVCVDVEPFYWYESADGSVLGVSAGKHDGWKLHAVCTDKKTGLPRPHTYLPCYALALKDGKAVSLPGLRNEAGSYKGLWDAARTYNGDASTFAILEPSAVDHYEYLLQTIEFATQNPQTVQNGALNMRFSDSDSCTMLSATSGVVNKDFGASLVVGQNVCIRSDGIWGAKKATHTVQAFQKCDADGTPNESGTSYLVTLASYADAGTYTVGTAYKITAAPWNTGACNDVSTPSGGPVSLTDGKHPCRYRWRENPYGNQLMTCVDLVNKRIGNDTDGYSLEWYFLDDPLAYYPTSASKPDAADLAASWTHLEALDGGTYANGYVKARKCDPSRPEVKIPDTTGGGSSSTYFCDYANLVSGSAVRCVRRRGYLIHGTYGGPCYVDGSVAPSYASTYFGASLYMAQ